MRREYETVIFLQKPLTMTKLEQESLARVEAILDGEEIALKELVERNGCREDPE